MTSIWDQANPQLNDLAVYEPGKPIEETARELGVRRNQLYKWDEQFKTKGTDKVFRR